MVGQRRADLVLMFYFSLTLDTYRGGADLVLMPYFSLTLDTYRGGADLVLMFSFSLILTLNTCSGGTASGRLGTDV